MKFGCCVSLLPGAETLAGIAYARPLRELGYDYIELSMACLTELSEVEFHQVRRKLEDSQLPCAACNDFIPPRFQLVGEERTSAKALERYLSVAFKRMEILKIPHTVFGSPLSRRCPDGFSRARAFDQIAAFLRRAGELAADYGVSVAVEHNNRTTTNMLNHYTDVVAMARMVDRPNVEVMCDYYHMRIENDSPEVLLEAGMVPIHTHIARTEGRQYFTTLEEELPTLSRYAEILTQLCYNGGVSVEAVVPSQEAWKDLAEINLRLLRKVFGDPVTEA